MKFLNLTLPTPEENLAADEALLDACDEDNADELLRFWESPTYFVVVGYANDADREVNLAYCRTHSLPVRRRCTGGGTVVQGPGCLNYSLILKIDAHPSVQNIDSTNRYILNRHRDAFASLDLKVESRGQTDLTLAGLKFSGNAQRRKRRSLIFHGTFLHAFDLARITATLPMPSSEPAYRQHRPHADFLTNLPVTAAQIQTALQSAWSAHDPYHPVPFARLNTLVAQKYANPDFHFRTKTT